MFVVFFPFAGFAFTFRPAIACRNFQLALVIAQFVFCLAAAFAYRVAGRFIDAISQVFRWLLIYGGFRGLNLVTEQPGKVTLYQKGVLGNSVIM